jgi:hypothetical protein
MEKDKKLFGDKLKDYQIVDVSQLKAGDHVRYVRREYESKNLKCVYAVIDSCEEDQDLSVHSYVPENSTDAPYSWQIKRKSVPYMRFYQKVKK